MANGASLYGSPLHICSLTVRSPYQPGNIISLAVSHSTTAEVLHFKINAVISSTQSCVVTAVPVDCLDPTHEYVLKLYNRRFSEGLREDHGLPAWKPSAEQEFLDHIRSGGATSFVAKYGGFFYCGAEGWRPLEDETCSQHICNLSYKAEAEAYAALTDLQGTRVPKLHHEVYWDPFDKGDRLSQENTDFLKIRGFVLEFVHGITLRGVPDQVPRNFWQALSEDAIAVVNLISDRHVLNRDVRLDNFIVREKPESSLPYESVMIDFGMSEIWNQQEESWDSWRKRKYSQDEEGAVGCVLKLKLKNRIEYERSKRFYDARDHEE